MLLKVLFKVCELLRAGSTAIFVFPKELPPDTKPIHTSFARNVFSCVCAGANTGATCIRSEMNFLKSLANMRKMIPQKCFLHSRECEYRPRMYSRKNYPKMFFPHALVLCRGAWCSVLWGGGGKVDVSPPTMNVHLNGGGDERGGDSTPVLGLETAFWPRWGVTFSGLVSSSSAWSTLVASLVDRAAASF